MVRAQHASAATPCRVRIFIAPSVVPTRASSVYSHGRERLFHSTPVTLSHILCPVDLSEASQHALEQATALAGWYHATLTVLYVHPPGPATVSYTHLTLPTSDLV